MKPIRKRRGKPAAGEVAAALPVRPTAFAVLAALAAEPRAGFDILDAIDRTVPRHSILGPGTLYRLLRELRRSGWIERTAPPSDEDAEDERRQFHTLTPLGRAVLVAESDRLRATLRAAGLWSTTSNR